MGVVVALIFAFCLASASAKTIDRSGRIMGGQEAPEGFAPWTVILRFDGIFYGSAVIVNERFVSSSRSSILQDLSLNFGFFF